MNVKIVPIGDSALQVIYSDPISRKLQQKIAGTEESIIKADIKGVLELVPSIQTLTIYYDPMILSYSEAYHSIKNICQKEMMHNQQMRKEIITIPTCYEDEFGADLEKVASLHNITCEEVITLHSRNDYFVYMIGFLPGFPYLQGLDERLYTPRLSEPRLHVPRGAVGIGGDQTGIYPLESPGGWNLIGRTPLILFDPLRSSPFLVKAGDYIRFQPISKGEFYAIEHDIQTNRYTIQREVVQIEND